MSICFRYTTCCDSFQITKLLRLDHICHMGLDLFHDNDTTCNPKHCECARGLVGRDFFFWSGCKSRYQRPRYKPMAHKNSHGHRRGGSKENVLRLTHCKNPVAFVYNNSAFVNIRGYQSKQENWKHEITEKGKWIQKYNENRVWVEREESWECKIAPPWGNRIILWADGSSLCVGWHFPVTPSRVMLCDVCDWLLPRPWEATEPRGHLLLACSILGIVYFSSVCSFLPLPLILLPPFLVSPVLSVSLPLFQAQWCLLSIRGGCTCILLWDKTPDRWLLRGNLKPCL